MQPTPDSEYPSQIWTPSHSCEHPRQAVRFTGQFPPEDWRISVFAAHCLQCGSKWTQEDHDAPWSQLMEKLANGEFGVVSFDDDDIARKVDIKRKLRYDMILEDACGSSNPIADGPDVRPID